MYIHTPDQLTLLLDRISATAQSEAVLVDITCGILVGIHVLLEVLEARLNRIHRGGHAKRQAAGGVGDTKSHVQESSIRHAEAHDDRIRVRLELGRDDHAVHDGHERDNRDVLATGLDGVNRTLEGIEARLVRDLRLSAVVGTILLRAIGLGVAGDRGLANVLAIGSVGTVLEGDRPP